MGRKRRVADVIVRRCWPDDLAPGAVNGKQPARAETQTETNRK